ncbi:MAG: hypothetical protein RQ743_06865 [Bacteroidales bacterium]|nr:hypothetical protein [Bacteroidales bacterium]
MKKRNIIERKIRDLLNDQEGLSADQKRDIEEIYDMLLNEDIPEPPDSLDDRFYSIMKDKRPEDNCNYRIRRSLVITMLSQDSPSERIKAVNMVSEMNEVDSKIIESMLRTLNNDSNDNVRLVALETLTLYVDYLEVREELVRSISIQESPLIQYRLAEIMQALQEKKSVPEFQKVLNDLTLDYSVRERINETIKVLL